MTDDTTSHLHTDEDQRWPETKKGIVRDAFGVALATGAYGTSFGAISIASGLTLLQTCILSLVMFTGGSQFALVGVIAGGGNPVAGAATAAMLGSRNALYGIRMAALLKVKGWRRFATAQLVIDETTAMAVGRHSERASRLGFYATGLLLFTLWNLGTLVGGIGADFVSDPKVLGLDAAATGAFVALLAPQVRGGEAWAIALAAGAVAVASSPFVPGGVPVLIAALVALAFGFRPGTNAPKDEA